MWNEFPKDPAEQDGRSTALFASIALLQTATGNVSFFVLGSDFHGNIQALENLEQKFIFQLGTFIPYGISPKKTYPKF